MMRETLAKKLATVVTGATMGDVANAIAQIGNPKPETIHHARSLRFSLYSVR